MADSTPTPLPQPDPSGSPITDPPPRQRKRRRWPWITGGVLVLLLVLLLLAPWIASMGWVRNIVVSRLNANLNGVVRIDDWDLNWRGGTEVRGLQVFQEGAQILQIQRLSTQLSLLGVLRGDYFTFGKTKIEGLSFTLIKYADGTTNFARLTRPQTTDEPPPAPTESAPGQPLRLPDVSGAFEIDFWGTIDDRQLGRTIILDRSHLAAGVPNINSPITSKLDLLVRAGGGAPGRLTASGTMDAIEGNMPVAAEQIKADQELALENFDVAGLAAFADLSETISQLDGIANGRFTVRTGGDDRLTFVADLGITNVVVAGPALGNDIYRTSRLAISLPATTLKRSTGQLVIGSGTGEENLALKTDEATITLSADTSLEAVRRALASQTPGAGGQVTLTADVELQKLAEDLPYLLGVQDGMKVTSGALHNVTTLTFQSDRTLINQQLDILNLKGTSQNQTVSADPIHLALTGSSLGGEGAIPDLRDLDLLIKSGFAQITGAAPNIANLKITGEVNLAAAQEQIAQFYTPSKSALAGTASFSVSTQGDLTGSGGTAQASLSLVGNQLRIENLGGQTLVQPHADVSASGQLVRGQKTFIGSIRNAILTAKTGDPQNPTLDTRALGEIALGETVTLPQFNLERLSIDLARAQREFAPFLAPLNEKNIAFTAGRISLSGAGGFDGAAATLSSITGTIDGVSIERRLGPQQILKPLVNYSAPIDVQGRIQASGGRLDARFAKLTIGNSKNDKLVGISKVGEGDLVVTIAENGNFSVNGGVELRADLRAINDLAVAFSDNAAVLAEPDEAGQLERGVLTGTLAMASAQAGETTLNGDFAISDLAVTTQGEPFRTESVTLTLRASAAHDLSRLTAQQFSLKSDFAEASISEAELAPRAASTFDQIQRAKLTATIPDARRFWAVISALTPRAGASEEVKSNAAPAQKAKAPPPVVFRSGRIEAALNVNRDAKGLNVSLDRFAGQDISFGRGNSQFSAPQVGLTASALVLANAGAPSLMEQIREIQVSKMEGDLAIGAIVLDEPIVIRDPAGTMTAAGAIRINGDLRRVSDLLDAVRIPTAEPAERYAGQYTFAQKLSTQGQTVTAMGRLDVNNFAIVPPAGARDAAAAPRGQADIGNTPISRAAPPESGASAPPTGRQRIGRRAAPTPAPQPRGQAIEDQIALVNDLALDQQARSLTIRKLDLSMPRTNALALTATGAIVDTADTRKFHDTKVVYSYDLAALSRFIAPMMVTPESRKMFEDLQLRGVAKNREIVITGGYPTEEAQKGSGRVKDPFRHIKAVTSFPLEYINYDSLELDKPADIPIVLSDGKLRVAHDARGDGQFPEPLQFSGGRVDLGGLEFNILTRHLTATAIRKDFKLVDSVEIGPEFFEIYLADLHPIFSVPKNSRGVATVVVNELQKLPLDRSIMRTKNNDGRGAFSVTLSELALDSIAMNLIASQLQLRTNPDGSVTSSIENAKIVIEKGQVRSDLALSLGGQSLAFRNASIDLSTRRINSMLMTVPREMLPFLREQRFLKPVIEVPVSGSVTRPNFDIVQAALRTALPSNPNDLIDNLGNLLNRDGGERGRDNVDRERPRRNQADPPPGTISRPPR